MSKSILIVEDNPTDFLMMKRGFEKVDADYEITHKEDGDQAIAYLEEFRKDKGLSIDGIILDLNMPGTDGREVLVNIKDDDSTKMIPTLVFTSSNDPSDVERSYDDGANTYIPKPMEINGYNDIISMIHDLWFED